MIKKTILEQEISQQPDVLQRLLDAESGNVRRTAAALEGRFEYVTIAARGSSDNAARYAQYLFGAFNGLQVALATPSLFTLYQRPPNLAGALVLGISQSGQSPDIVEAVAEGRRQGRPTLAITNDPASPLAAAAEHVIPLHTGVEQAVAATKTYTASLGALALLSCILAGDEERLNQLQNIPIAIGQTITSLAPVLQRVERYRYMSHAVVIGRGFNYSTAFEIALKIKELTSIITEPYSSADFRHGPIALVGDGFPVLVVAPSGQVSDDLRALVADIRRLSCELLIISDQQALLEQSHLPLPITADLPEWLTPLVSVVPGQLFALELAQARGMDPDQPAGLRKVTETL